MALEIDPMQDSGTIENAPSPDATTEAKPQTKLDDAYEELFGNAAEDSPGIDELFPEEEQEEYTEDSGETEEQETPEDDSDIDTQDVEEEAAEEVEEDTAEDALIVDYDEAKQFKFEVDGQLYAIGDFKAALKRQANQKEALNEMDTRRAELDKQQEELNSRRDDLQAEEIASSKTQEIATLDNQIDQLVKAKQQALATNNGNALAIINSRISDAEARKGQINDEINASHDQLAERAAQHLDELGYGSLTADPQRAEAFREHVFGTYPDYIVSLANRHAPLMVAMEKARLYDSSTEKRPKGKLRGQAASIKAGAKKPPKPQKPKSRLDASVDRFLNPKK